MKNLGYWIFGIVVFALGFIGLLREKPAIKVETENAVTAEILDNRLRQDVFYFLKSKTFNTAFSDYINKLETEKEMTVFNVSDEMGYVVEVVSNDIDGQYFSVQIMLGGEDENGRMLVVPVKFIASKETGKPEQEFMQNPATEEWMQARLIDNTEQLTLYDAALYYAMKEKI